MRPGSAGRFENVARLGRVEAIDASRIHLERGSIPLPPGTLIVDCSAAGIPSVEAVPVWAGERITPQWVRSFGTVFSAALIAHVEATFADDAEKNALPPPPRSCRLRSRPTGCACST